jgi:hypothetical protein
MTDLILKGLALVLIGVLTSMHLFKKQREAESESIILLKICFLCLFLLSMACWGNIAEVATHGPKEMTWGLLVGPPAMFTTFLSMLPIARKSTRKLNHAKVKTILGLLFAATIFDFLSCSFSEIWVLASAFAKGYSLYASFQLMNDKA